MRRHHGPCYMCQHKGWNRALVPMFLSLGAFISGIMALFAGRTWNIMEDYELMLLKTVVLTDWAKSGSHLTDPTTASPHIAARNAAVKDRPKDDPLLLKRVGPPYDFYSLHGTGICMGWYLPRPDDPNPHREVQNCTSGYFTDEGLNLYELLVSHTNGTIANLSDAGNVKADLKTLYGAHKALTLMFTVAVGFYGIFAFFTTWFAVYNPLKHKSYAKNRHKIIIWFHWITSMICGILGLLSGAVGASMTPVAVKQLNVHWGAHHIEANMGMKWIPVMFSSVGMMVLVWVWWNWMWMRLLGIRIIWWCVKDDRGYGVQQHYPQPQHHRQDDDGNGNYFDERSDSPRSWAGMAHGGAIPLQPAGQMGPQGFPMAAGPHPMPMGSFPPPGPPRY